MDVKRAADLYARGWTLRQIGAELGVHWSTVSQQLQSAGVTMRRSKPSAHSPSTQQILELRDQGLTWPEIPEQVDMTVSGVWSRYRRARPPKSSRLGRWIALAVAGNLVDSCHLPLRIPLEDYGAMETTSPEKGSSRVVVLVAIVGLISTITASALSGIFTTLGVHDQFEQQRLAQSQDLRRGVYEEYLASTTQACIVFLFAGSSDAQKNSAVKKLEDAHARALLVSKENLREPLDNFNDYMYQVANQGNDCEAQYEKLRDEFIEAAKADLETG